MKGMATMNIGAEATENIHPEKALAGLQNGESCIQLLNQWLADESGYDEENWPKIRALLEENATRMLLPGP